jgi:hypothetical protein
LEKEEINFFRLTTLDIIPFKIDPLGVNLLFKSTQELLQNFTNDESFFKIWCFDFIKIPLCLDFFGIGFSGKTSIAEHFIKSPVNAIRPFEPLYKWKTLAFSIPQLSVGLKIVLFCIILNSY